MKFSLVEGCSKFSSEKLPKQSCLLPRLWGVGKRSMKMCKFWTPTTVAQRRLLEAFYVMHPQLKSLVKPLTGTQLTFFF